MSDRPYSLWLRLYPTDFREQHGEEIRQLIHDRMRDETGALRKLRLFLDLSWDLAISAPRLYLNTRDRTSKTEDQESAGPQFSLIDQTRPSQPIFLASTVLSFFLVRFVQQLYPCPDSSVASLIPLLTRLHQGMLHR